MDVLPDGMIRPNTPSKFLIEVGRRKELVEVFETVKGWIRANWVWCLWLGTPCNTFSKVRRAPPGSAMPSALRSPAQPRGLAGLAPKDQAKLREGNALADRAGLATPVIY